MFVAGCRIAQHFGRPGTPNVQAWVESFFGHLRGENPHLDKITDAGDLEAELENRRHFYNEVRLHESIGYVTPDDEHKGRGDVIRQPRRDGMTKAAETRVATDKQAVQDETWTVDPGWVFEAPTGAFTQICVDVLLIRGRRECHLTG